MSEEALNVIIKDMEKIIDPIIPAWAKMFINKNAVSEMLEKSKYEVKKWLVKNRNLINLL